MKRRFVQWPRVDLSRIKLQPIRLFSRDGIHFLVMGLLADNIRKAVRDERFVIGDHADERLTTRGIMDWQVVAGLEHARLLLEREDGIPHPVAEFEEVLADGTPIKAVWAWISEQQIAKLVTVYFFPRMGPWN